MAERVPKAAKTGNAERDAIAERYRACFMEIIDACMEESVNIACAYGAIQARRTAQSIDSSADANATFAKATQIDRLDVKWLMQFVAQHTDLTMSDTLAIYKADARAPLEVVCYLTELPFALRLPKQCLVKWVLFEVCKQRYLECGSRGAEFKKKGGVNADKTMNWRDHGAYQLKLSENVCTQVVHPASGLAIAPPEGVLITTKFVLRNNFSDHLAYVECPPIPQINLAKFFEPTSASSSANVGPYVYSVIGGGHNKNFNDAATKQYQKWEEEQDKNDICREVVDGMAEAKSAEASKRLKTAREKAAESLKLKRQKRSITLG